MMDDKLTECPSCKEQSLERLILTGNPFVLKGGGWYKSGRGLG
jgi:predicted nucleic acid-binding Zn ribbon protein